MTDDGRTGPVPPPPGEQPGEADRLVRSPVFLLFTPRSGSTLLRLILDSHPQIRAPHELWLRTVRVTIPRAMAQPAMAGLGLDERGLEHLLWDRVLHRELARSGKDVIVDKSPFNAHICERLVECWPQARFVFLLRNPAAIVASYSKLFPTRSPEKVTKEVLSHASALQHARESLAGLTVRYEDFVADPEREIAALCEFLGVPWEPRMLEYGAHDHGPESAARLGDPSERLRTGRIQSVADQTPPPLSSPELRELALAWGFSQA